MFHFLKVLDIKIFFLINQTFSNPVFDSIMPLITNKNNWILIIIVLLFYLTIYNGKRGKIAFIILIIAVGITDSFSSFILKPYFERIRPSHEIYEHINLLIARGGKWSMPSNHAANISAIAVILSYFYDKWKIPLYSLAVIIAFSRVYVGVHYPADVLVGGLIGYGMAWLILTLWVILKMRELKRGQTWVWYEGDLQNK
jgi:undecaprenyl-diphosphatase